MLSFKGISPRLEGSESMASRKPKQRGRDIDEVLRQWPFRPGVIMARKVQASDGREVVQMRVEMGILQMETEHRPDGTRPGGANTYLDYVARRAARHGPDFVLSARQCAEMDREFLQYYHRRICWLALREFERAVGDADHTLAMMDFATRHSPSPEWTLSHEQYRPLVLFHRTQAAALAELDQSGPEAAIEAIAEGLVRLRSALAASEMEEDLPDERHPLVEQLVELQEWIREHFEVGKTLSEQLAEAVAAEQYELAARLRDEIARRRASDPKQRGKA